MKRGRLLAGLVILFAIFLCVGCVQPDDPTDKTEEVTVSVQTDGNGTLTAAPDGEVEKGTSVTVEIAADEGYELASFTVNEADKLAEVSQNKYTFTANEDTVVEASFRALVYTVTGIVQTADGNLDGLEVVFMSGLDRYPAKVAADGSYSVSVPSGVYGAVFTHEYFAEVRKDAIAVKGNTTMETVVMDAYRLGESAVGEVAARGSWQTSGNTYTSDDGRVNTLYVAGVSGTQYYLRSTLRYQSGYGIPRPGLIVAQDEDWIVVFSGNMVEVATGAEWFGLCRIRTDDTNGWEYMDATNVRLTDTGMCDERGAEVIVIRDGASVKVYLNGQKVVDAEDCTWLTADRATAPGLFTDYAVTQFEDVTFSYDLTELDDLLDEPSAGEEIGGLGDSPVGGVPAVGNWNALGDGGVQASGRSYTFLEGKGTSYVVQANLRVTMSGALPRPGLVVAQNAEWIVAACFNLSVAGTDYYGLLRVSTSDINTWEFDPYSVSSPAYGVRTEGAMLTAVRDGNDIWLFIDGRLVYRALDHAWLNETEETAAGLFNEDCTSEFTQVSFAENGVAEWIAKADMSRYGESVAIEGGERLIDSAYIIKDAEIAEASYAVQVTIRAEGTMGAQCRPGIIFGRHTANGLVFYETVSFSGDEWVGLMSVPEMLLIGDGAGLDCRDYVQKAGGYGLSAGITLTVLRHEGTIYVYVGDTLVLEKTLYDGWATEAVAGIFTDLCTAFFTGYSLLTGAELDPWLEKLPSTPEAPVTQAMPVLPQQKRRDTGVFSAK